MSAPSKANPPRPGRPQTGRPPARPDGNTRTVPISMFPADLADLDALAASIAEPGMIPNRSAAFRLVMREWREEARGGSAGG